ncbi:MAG: zeta toxin family protein, partial [Synergistaceae bacterium]|nr:zeta toxin family protein [Synergistaceae bacterium]
MRDDDRPVLIVIAGPNGSGKSTITESLEQSPGFPDLYINADEIKKDEGLTDMEAWEKAERQRANALNNRESFAFETVFSHPGKIGLMQQAKDLGYWVRLYFICTQNADINVLRVRGRYNTGGHDVPEDKIRNRYLKSMQLLSQILPVADEAYIFNNSWERPEMIARKTQDGRLHVYPLQANDIRSAWTREAIEKLIGLK